MNSRLQQLQKRYDLLLQSLNGEEGVAGRIIDDLTSKIARLTTELEGNRTYIKLLEKALKEHKDHLVLQQQVIDKQRARIKEIVTAVANVPQHGMGYFVKDGQIHENESLPPNSLEAKLIKPNGHRR